jgi:hypothetical protein
MAFLYKVACRIYRQRNLIQAMYNILTVWFRLRKFLIDHKALIKVKVMA